MIKHRSSKRRVVLHIESAIEQMQNLGIIVNHLRDDELESVRIVVHRRTQNIKQQLDNVLQAIDDLDDQSTIGKEQS